MPKEESLTMKTILAVRNQHQHQLVNQAPIPLIMIQHLSLPVVQQQQLLLQQLALPVQQQQLELQPQQLELQPQQLELQPQQPELLPQQLELPPHQPLVQLQQLPLQPLLLQQANNSNALTKSALNSVRSYFNTQSENHKYK